MDPKKAIPILRESAVAIFRYRTLHQQTVTKGKVHPAQVSLGWGSGFCVVADQYIITAYHVIKEGRVKNSTDKFIAFVVPGNGDQAFDFPVIGFPCEMPEADLAILQIGPTATSGVHLPAIPVTFEKPPDGSRVVTIGFPAPEVASVNIDSQGEYRGGQFFLKSHANEGMLSAQYNMGLLHVYEFNVGWHHGESGGPVVRLDEPIAAFTIMQQYRNVQSPHGIVAGPHRGCAFSAIRSEIEGLGARVV